MNWCLVLNDFQTPPKKSMNSISFMHISPLPWVFLQKHKVFYNHTQTDPATLDRLSTFFSPCPFLKVPCYPPYISGRSGPSPLSQSHVCDTGTLPWMFVLEGESSQMEHFSGSFLLCAAGAGKTSWDRSPCCGHRAAKKDLGAGSCATQRRSGPGWGTRWISPIPQ